MDERAGAAQGERIVKTVVLKAPIERVWRAITDHEEFGTWFERRSTSRSRWAARRPAHHRAGWVLPVALDGRGDGRRAVRIPLAHPADRTPRATGSPRRW